MYTIKKDGQRTQIKSVDAMSSQEFVRYLRQQSKILISDLWSYRELIHNLVLQDLKVRYKNSFLGIFWSLLNPLLMMAVFTAVFTIMRGEAIKSFPVFVLMGLLPWQFFANSIMACTSCIVGNGHLINKVYFPREILVISSVTSNLINFLIALLLVIPVLLFFNITLTPWILLLPIVILIQYIFTLGIGFLVATANVFYRDIQMIVDVILLAGFFLTPIFYPLDTLPRSYYFLGVEWDIWRLMYYLNPMASIIANYRVITLDSSAPALDFLIRTFATALLCLGLGLIIFYQYKSRFSEEV